MKSSERKARKQAEAQERQARHELLSPQERLAKVRQRTRDGQALKEKARLQGLGK